MDNFYTSPSLFENLKRNGTYACGTIRKNRGEFPKTFIEEKPTRGNSSYVKRKDGNVLVVHWFDKRDVFVLSSIHDTGDVDIKRRGRGSSV